MNLTCSRCRESKEPDEFHKSKQFGRQKYCKLCAREKVREWQLANKEKHYEHNNDWRRRNPEKANAQSRRQYERHRNRKRAQNERWRQLNKNKWVVYAERRRAREAAAISDLTEGEWKGLLSSFGQSCAYCQKPHERLVVEHMMPLSRGGDHTLTNVVPACPSCNGKKHRLTTLEFLVRNAMGPGKAYVS